MDEISATIKQLRLPGMEQCWRSLVETRRIDGMSLRDGLLLLLQAENEQRNENRKDRGDRSASRGGMSKGQGGQRLAVA